MEPEIERYGVEHTSPLPSSLAAVARATQEQTSAPQMMSGLVEARLLQTLIRTGQAARVLEVGTFTGLGALAMAEALEPSGTVTTIESDPDNARLARSHIDAHPSGLQVELLLGDAMELIGTLTGPFDLIYVDAWKPDYPTYYELVLPLIAPDGIIVFDNAFHGGRALVEGDPVGAFNDMVQADRRVENALLTVGDGMLLVWPRRTAPADG